MNRAAMLPMPGDPFILTNFLDNFTNIWSEYVDTLYVCLNIDHRVPKEVKDFDIQLLENTPKVKYIVTDEMLFQGAALRLLLNEVEERIITSIEDDTVIVKPDMIDRSFRLIEDKEADVVGSPRFSCSQEILDVSAERYGLDYTGYGDKGPNLWPNFFFIRKEHLLRTDLHFEPKGWEAGEYCKELDHTFEEVQSADVFVWLCMQLRAMGLKFYEVPQYHSHPDDLLDMAAGNNIFDGKAPWIHIGSLTMTMEDLIIQSSEPKEHRNMPKNVMEEMEFERRYAWLMLFLDNTVGKTEGLHDIRMSYEKRMLEFIKVFGLSMNRILKLKDAYRSFIRW